MNQTRYVNEGREEAIASNQPSPSRGFSPKPVTSADTVDVDNVFTERIMSLRIPEVRARGDAV